MQDYNSETVATFDKNAARYAEKYFSLRDYDQFYELIAMVLPNGPAHFLDLACGPGNVSAYVRGKRPNATIWCVDRSPLMLEAAARHIPGARSLLADCRDLSCIQERFDSASFFFGLSYFNDSDARVVLAELHRLLLPEAYLLLATVAGDPSLTGAQTNAAGDRVFSFYRTQRQIEEMTTDAGFEVELSTVIPSPANASLVTTDVVVFARRK